MPSFKVLGESDRLCNGESLCEQIEYAALHSMQRQIYFVGRLATKSLYKHRNIGVRHMSIPCKGMVILAEGSLI